MTDTLCIAELADGRRALCYANPEERTADVLCILRQEDMDRAFKLGPRRFREPERYRANPAPMLRIAGPVDVEAIQGVIIPTPPPKRRITVEDLLTMEQTPTTDPATREEQILRDLERLTRGDEPEHP